MMFCFEDFAAGTCAGPLFGVVDSPEECCFTPERSGLGGGSFVESGNETCTSCMTIIGKPNIKFTILCPIQNCSVCGAMSMRHIVAVTYT